MERVQRRADEHIEACACEWKTVDIRLLESVFSWTEIYIYRIQIRHQWVFDWFISDKYDVFKIYLKKSNLIWMRQFLEQIYIFVFIPICWFLYTFLGEKLSLLIVCLVWRAVIITSLHMITYAQHLNYYYYKSLFLRLYHLKTMS